MSIQYFFISQLRHFVGWSVGQWFMDTKLHRKIINLQKTVKIERPRKKTCVLRKTLENEPTMFLQS